MSAILATEHGSQLHYVQLSCKRPLHVVFIHGFRSDKDGGKACFVEEWCRTMDISFVRFDLSAHGESSGNLAHCSVSLWLQDCLAVIDSLTGDDDVIVVGSSLGGWLMLLTALARPQKVAALLGIAAAPDCITQLLYDPLPQDTKEKLAQGETVMIESSHPDGDPYPITQHLIDDSRAHNLLNAPIDIHCPMRLIHGTHDDSVPFHYSHQILNAVRSDDAALTLIKDGDHRLSEPPHLDWLGQSLHSLIRAVKPSL